MAGAGGNPVNRPRRPGGSIVRARTRKKLIGRIDYSALNTSGGVGPQHEHAKQVAIQWRAPHVLAAAVGERIVTLHARGTRSTLPCSPSSAAKKREISCPVLGLSTGRVSRQESLETVGYALLGTVLSLL